MSAQMRLWFGVSFGVSLLVAGFVVSVLLGMPGWLLGLCFILVGAACVGIFAGVRNPLPALIDESISGGSEGVLWADENGAVVFANGAALQLLGYESVELEGKNLGMIQPALLMNLQERSRFCVDLKKRDGGSLKVELETRSWQGKGGTRFNGFFFSDRSELALTASELVRSRAALEAFLEQAPNGIIVCERNGLNWRVAACSAEARRLFDWESSKLPKWRLRDRAEPQHDPSEREKGSGALGSLTCYLESENIDLFDSEHAVPMDPFFQISSRSIRGDGFRASRVFHSSVPLCLVDPDGNARHVMWRAAPVVSKDGEHIGAVIVVADTTERREAGRQLQAALDREKQMRAEAQAMAERAQVASRAKGEFLAMMSHEIRTPLNSIMGYAGLLVGETDNPEHARNAETIIASAESLLRIISDVLDYSQLETNSAQFEFSDIDLAALLRRALELNMPAANSLGLRLSLKIDDEVPSWVRSDSGVLNQILLNLLGNAVKFTRKGTIELGVMLLEKREGIALLRFFVTDTGVGVPPGYDDQLFEPFTQVDCSVTREFGGTGLGLAVSKRLVEALGGEMGYDSVLGEGSTFWFTVPTGLDCAEAHDEVAGQDLDVVYRPLPSGLPALGGREEVCSRGQAPLPIRRDAERIFSQSQHSERHCSARVLVVEDNSANRDVLSHMLKKNGCHVDLAFNGQEAVRALESFDYDLVFMDIRMPVMDGFEATARIRQSLGTAKVTKIIAMTAHSDRETEMDCYAAGMDGYLSKPLSHQALQQSLSRHLPGRNGKTANSAESSLPVRRH